MAFTDPLRCVADFDAGDAEWLHLLVGDWQLVADLGFGLGLHLGFEGLTPPVPGAIFVDRHISQYSSLVLRLTYKCA